MNVMPQDKPKPAQQVHQVQQAQTLAQRLDAFGASSKDGLSVSVHQKESSFGSFARRATLTAGLILGVMHLAPQSAPVAANKAPALASAASSEKASESSYRMDLDRIKNSLLHRNVQSDTALSSAPKKPEMEPKDGAQQAGKPDPWMTPALEAAVRDAKFIDVKFEGQTYSVLSPVSRIALTKAVAEEVGLKKVGLNATDLYGAIYAESGWIPRNGMGANGVTSKGLAQFEPNTATSLGLKNVEDPLQAIYGAAVLLKEGAQWSAYKLREAGIGPKNRTDHPAFREGVSIHYNTSTALRKTWNVDNTDEFPQATQHHIKNSAAGRYEAKSISKKANFVGYIGGMYEQVGNGNINKELDSFKSDAKKLSAFVNPCKLEFNAETPDAIVSSCKDRDLVIDGMEGKYLQVGDINGKSVWLAELTNYKAGAAVARTVNADGSHKLDIIVERGLMQALNRNMPAGVRDVALDFVIHHELGHVDQHESKAKLIGQMSGSSVLDSQDPNKIEVDADRQSIRMLLEKGHSIEDIREGAIATLNTVFEYVTTEKTPPLIKQAMRVKLDERIQNVGVMLDDAEKELSESRPRERAYAMH